MDHCYLLYCDILVCHVLHEGLLSKSRILISQKLITCACRLCLVRQSLLEPAQTICELLSIESEASVSLIGQLRPLLIALVRLLGIFDCHLP